MRWQGNGFAKNLRARARAFVLFLLPHFLKTWVTKEESPPPKIHATSYLDGFRGFMSLLVFVRHFMLPWQRDLDYGFMASSQHTGFLRLPPFRILYSGPNVPVFLVVSGFVMSLKPLKAIRAREWDRIFNGSVSSIFKRAFRLFPPPIVSTALVMMATRCGLLENDYRQMHGLPPRRHPEYQPNFITQVADWLSFVFNDLTNPWTWSSPTSLYGPHLWTIPMQFRCSMALFLVLVGLAKTPQHVRSSILLLIFSYCMAFERWDVALYMSGMFLADQYLDRSEEDSNLPREESKLGKHDILTKSGNFLSVTLSCAALGIGAYLGSFPRANAGFSSPGFEWLFAVSSNYHIWHAYGGFLLVWSLGRLTWTQKFFSGRFMLMLGRLSFSLYIVHDPILRLCGFPLVNTAFAMFGAQSWVQYQGGLLLGLTLTTPIVLWTADIFQRGVDAPCARLAQWMQKHCFVKE